MKFPIRIFLALACASIAAAGCSRSEVPQTQAAAENAPQTQAAAENAPPTQPAAPASPFVDLQPGDDGFVSVPLARVTEKPLLVNVAKEGEPAVQLIAIRDGSGKARIAFNTCQACNPAPRAFFSQQGSGRLVCNNCGNTFGPESVGASARGCNPAAIPGVVETDSGFLVPAAVLDAARPAFARWSGPRE